MTNYILDYIILLPFFGIFIIAFSKEKNKKFAKSIALCVSGLVFLLSLLLWIFFDNSTAKFQYVECIMWLSSLNVHIFFGVDGISLFFIVLSTFLVFCCLLLSWHNIRKSLKEYLICFLLIETLLICVFASLDLITFYIFFESILIPMFLIVGVWGSRRRKIKAAYQFFLYTLVGSLLMLIGIFIIYSDAGTTDYQLLCNYSISTNKQCLLWLLFFASFSVKVPMVPFHIWLPEAHVEAPTAGSVILAGILLKMGTYALVRFSLCLFPIASLYFSPLVYTLSAIAVIYTSLTTLRQVDLKKAIAYSSVAHMGFVTVGIFTLNIYGIEGSILIMLSHGFISSGLFICVGVLYDRHHSRFLKYYGGLAQVMPLFSIFLTIFSLANLGFPLTSSFIGEFLTLIGAFQSSTTITFLCAIGMVLSAAYSLWFLNRILFGALNILHVNIFTDVNHLEFCILVSLITCVFILGIYPEIVLTSLHASVTCLSTFLIK